MVNSKKQAYLAAFLASFLVFLVAIFRQPIFWGNYTLAILYMVCVSASVLAMGYFAAKLLGFKPLYLLVPLVLCEFFLVNSFDWAPAFLAKVIANKGGKKRELLLPVAQKYQHLSSVAYGSRFNVYQYAHGHYNEGLFYKLNSGKVNFGNIEFNNTYQQNSMGYRSSEKSLQNPKIILLGDSFSFGIGVGQDETYASILEQKTGKLLLNTGVPSYGTARENIVLSQQNKDSLQLLLLQYCNNDLLENEVFNKKTSNFIGSKESFSVAFFSNLPKQYYYPFKYLFGVFSYNISGWLSGFSKQKNSVQNTANNHAKEFLPVFTQIRKQFKGPIIVFSLDISPDSTVYNNLAKALNTANYENVHTVNVLKNLKPAPEHFYIYDGHINKKGHQIVAQELLGYIEQHKLLK
jgi:hypothetical protein